MTAMHPTAAPFILELDGVRLRRTEHGSEQPARLSLRLRGGQMRLVRIEGSRWSTRVADLCCGLVRPEAGRVRFLGEDWAALPDERALLRRSMIGRVFRRANWIAYQSVCDGVVLARAHHSARPVREWIARASEIAADFGLPGLPLARPDRLSLDELGRAACVRAFLGSPWLVLLQEPAGGDLTDFLAPLLNHARRARDRGAAVLWLTRSERAWAHDALGAFRRSRFDGRRLHEVPA